MARYHITMYNDIRFRKTKQKINKKKIYGFDIETYSDKNKLLLIGIESDKFKKVYYDSKSFVIDLKYGMYKNCIFSATNLSFDFFGTFLSNDWIKDFNFIFRGSDLISAWTYIYNRKFNKHANKHANKISFIDTMNYAKMSVDKLGKIIGIPKLPHPDFLGKKPKNKRQWEEMIKYNLRDCEVSRKGTEFLFKSFEQLGATAKMTIASTSMSLFKNKYLGNSIYYRHDPELLREIFKSYYGGRTESFCRGQIKDYNYYDINSLYPSVMLNEFPDPNTVRRNNINSIDYITQYDGVSDVLLECPYMEYPLLPYRTPDKLIFPVGKFRGYYTNVELRKAITLGYKILKVYRNIYYTGKCRPFKDFVTDLYAKRLEYKKINSPMQYVCKIILNSLYGKFAQKFDARENLIPLNHTAEELSKYDKFEIIDDKYIRITESINPPSFTVPIWSSYVTAYARLVLHDYILISNPVYVDTDSIITKTELENVKDLGRMKLEMYIENGVIVKPKFYGFSDGTVKIKGVGTKVSFIDFKKLLIDPTVTYKKFMKFKESLRRGLVCNEILDMTKTLDLNDTKRFWESDFNGNFQTSQPLNICTTETFKDLSEVLVCQTKKKPLSISTKLNL